MSEKYLEILKSLLEEIMSSRKVSIGSAENTYSSQFDRSRIDGLYKNLTSGSPLDDAAPDASVDKGCVTISELEEIAKRHNYTHIVMLSIKPGNYQFVASYGESTLQADQAAQMANRLKDLLGWPESLHAIPDRVQTLFDKIKKYESILKTHDLGREAGI